MNAVLRCLRLSGAVSLVLLQTGAFPVQTALGAQQSTTAAGSPSSETGQHQEITPEQRADIFMVRKDYSEAADYYYRALKLSGFKDAKLWNKLGIAFQQENRFSNARKAYNHALGLDKNFAEAWNNIGTVYFMLKKYGKSIPFYQRAIKLNDHSAAFHINLGSSYYHMKKFDPAVEEYRAALAIDPTVVSQQSSTGTIIHAGGTDVEFYYYMAKAFASLGDAKEAVRYLRRAFEDGYGTPQNVAEDPDFKKISQDPDFVELMRNPPVAIKE